MATARFEGAMRGRRRGSSTNVRAYLPTVTFVSRCFAPALILAITVPSVLQAKPPASRAFTLAPDSKLLKREFRTSQDGLKSMLSSNDVSLWHSDWSNLKSREAKLTDRADKLLKTADEDEAIKLYSEAIKESSSFGPAYLGRARAQTSLGHYKEAFLDLDKAVESKSKIVRYAALNDRAKLYEALRNYDKAIVDYSEIIKVNKASQAPFAARAHCYMRVCKYDLAIEDLDCALKVKPNALFVLRDRARAHFDAHQYKKAIADCSQVLKLDPAGKHSTLNNGDVLAVRCESYELLGEAKLAEADRKTLAAHQQQHVESSQLRIKSHY